MFKLLIGLFAIIGFLFLFTGMLGIRFLRALFGLGRKDPDANARKQTDNTYADTSDKGKIFDKSEGEYVDFEEIE